MPHLAHDILTSDPEGLARLREMLHGLQGTPTAMPPDLAERFGVAGKAEAIVPALARKARRRRASATCPAATLVTP